MKTLRTPNKSLSPYPWVEFGSGTEPVLLSALKLLVALGLLIWCLQGWTYAQTARWLITSQIGQKGLDKITSNLSAELAPLTLGYLATLYAQSGQEERVFSANFQQAGFNGSISLDEGGVRRGVLGLSLHQGIFQFNNQINWINNGFQRSQAVLGLHLFATDLKGTIALNANNRHQLDTQLKHQLDPTTSLAGMVRWVETGDPQAVLTVDYKINKIGLAFTSLFVEAEISQYQAVFQAPFAADGAITISTVLSGARQFEGELKAAAEFIGSSLYLAAHYSGARFDELELQWSIIESPYRLDAEWRMEAGFLRLSRVNVATEIDQFSYGMEAQFDAVGLKAANFKASITWDDYSFSMSALYTGKGFKGAALKLGKRFSW